MRRLKVEELTSFSQEAQSIHVAVVADLSQLLRRSRMCVCSSFTLQRAASTSHDSFCLFDRIHSVWCDREEK